MQLVHELSEKEAEVYQALVLEVLQEMGFGNRFEVYRAGKKNEFWRKLGIKVEKDMNLENVYTGYVFGNALGLKEGKSNIEQSRKLCLQVAARQLERHTANYNREIDEFTGIGQPHHKLMSPSEYKKRLNQMLETIIAGMSLD